MNAVCEKNYRQGKSAARMVDGPPGGLPKHLRVRARSDFLRAQEFGDKVHSKHFVWFFYVRAELQAPEGANASRHARALLPLRLGVTVSKRVGNAPARNRTKRLLREAFRIERHKIPLEGIDMVGIAKPGASELGLMHVREELRKSIRTFLLKFERKKSSARKSKQ